MIRYQSFLEDNLHDDLWLRFGGDLFAQSYGGTGAFSESQIAGAASTRSEAVLDCLDMTPKHTGRGPRHTLLRFDSIPCIAHGSSIMSKRNKRKHVYDPKPRYLEHIAGQDMT